VATKRGQDKAKSEFPQSTCKSLLPIQCLTHPVNVMHQPSN